MTSRTAFAGGHSGSLEAALLFDACVTVPALYALCYWRKRALWQTALRMLGVACLGIYAMSWIVPPEAQRLLPSFEFARTIGLALLIAIELRIVFVTLKLVFRGKADAEQIAAATGAPPLIAKLMILEARFYKAVWRFLRRGG
ncbi:hypothetical protein GCM10023325_13170 [Sphingomonas lutea]